MKTHPNAKLYTVAIQRRNQSFAKRTHYSSDAGVTFCGLNIDEKYFILTNDFSGVATCEACLKKG